MDERRRALYDWKWQKLRVSLAFTSQNRTIVALNALRSYCQKAHGKDPEINRVYRCLNLLCAVRMGIEGRKKLKEYNHTAELDSINELVMTAREEYSSSYYKLQKQGKEVQLYQVATERMGDLLEGIKDDRLVFDFIKKDLEHRFYRGAGAKVNKNDEEAVTERARLRPELAEFLGLLQMAEDTYEER